MVKSKGAVLLRQRRRKGEWSQGYVAEKLGVNPSMVTHYETGRKKPSARTRKALWGMFRIPAGSWEEVVTS